MRTSVKAEDKAKTRAKADIAGSSANASERDEIETNVRLVERADSAKRKTEETSA